LPEALWQAAVEMASQYGVHRTASQLRLDYTRHLPKGAAGWNAEARKSHSSFVELLARPAKPEECIMQQPISHPQSVCLVCGLFADSAVVCRVLQSYLVETV